QRVYIICVCDSRAAIDVFRPRRHDGDLPLPALRPFGCADFRWYKDAGFALLPDSDRCGAGRSGGRAATLGAGVSNASEASESLKYGPKHRFRLCKPDRVALHDRMFQKLLIIVSREVDPIVSAAALLPGQSGTRYNQPRRMNVRRFIRTARFRTRYAGS